MAGKQPRPGGATLVGDAGADQTAAPAVGRRSLVDEMFAQAASLGEKLTTGGGIGEQEGGSFFAAAGTADIRKTTPPAAKPKPAPVAQGDTDFESAAGFAGALGTTMKPVPGISGASFEAINAGGVATGKVIFTFDRLFVGTHDVDGKTHYGCSVSIGIKLVGIEPLISADVRVVQIVREFTMGPDNRAVGQVPNPDAKTDSRDKRDEQIRKDRSVKDGPSKGWRVDNVPSNDSPFYLPDRETQNGNRPTAARDGRMRDAPDVARTNVGKEFRTAAVSYSGGQGFVLAAVDWGFFVDGGGNVSLYPAQPKTYTGNIAELIDASRAWDARPDRERVGIGRQATSFERTK